MNRTNDASHHTATEFGKLLGLSVAIAVAAWCVGYIYLVKVAGYPAASFFTLKMMVGVSLLSFVLSGVLWLRFRSRR